MLPPRIYPLLLRNSKHWVCPFSTERPAKYILSQFPYPSGDLHLGHARVYSIGDTLARYYTLRGQKVLYPMGWDSFGLPAQNAALLHKQNPKTWTQQNIARMRSQLQTHLKIPFPWDRQISTCDPSYYRFTQLIFLKMYHLGLAYKAEAEVNWDPVDNTVLANEQVDENGYSWRSGAKVEKRVLNQWFLNIKQFAQQLSEGLNHLDKWVGIVKQMQRGWIGLKKGCSLKGQLASNKQVVQVFVEVDHNQPTDIWKNNFEVWLNEEGEGTDEMTFNGVNKTYIVRKVKEPSKQERIYSIVFTGTKPQKSSEFMTNFDMVQFKKSQTMRLKDWLISRQRYWGTPIPIIYCKNCGTVPVPQSDLPVILPDWPQNQQVRINTNPLLQQKFKKCNCPKCGSTQAQRESDTMDTFVDSSWYYLRFLDPHNNKEIADIAKVISHMPVKIYIGGMEHAIMHLLYARFVYRVLHRCGLTGNSKEPFEQLIVQGLIKGKTYKLKSNNAYLKRQQIFNHRADDILESYEKMSKSKFNGISPGEILEKFSVDQLRIALLFSGPPQNDIDFGQQMLLNARKFLTKVRQIVEYLVQLLNSQKKRSKEQLKIIVNTNLLNLTSGLVFSISELLQKLELSMQKRMLHTYIANAMELTNLIKRVIMPGQTLIAEKEATLESKINLVWTLLLIIKPVAPEFSGDMLQKIKSIEQLKIVDLEERWPDFDRQQIQVMLKRGTKVYRKQQVDVNISDDQLLQHFSLGKGEVISVKRLKKNIVIVTK